MEMKKRVFKNIAIIFVLTFVFMTCYEFLKQFIIPGITIWTSHIITIIVTSVLAVFIASIPLLRTEKVLDELNEKQEEIEQMETAIIRSNEKLNMLSSITRHDILNLLTVIKAYTEMISDSKDIVCNPEYDEYLDKIKRSVESLNRVIVSTRDYQDIGVKKPVWIDVREIFLRIYDENSHFHKYRAVPPEEDIEIYADSMFERVIYNLMDNTLKHAEKATFIRLSFSHENGTGYLIYEDDGAGISEDEKEKIFYHTYGKNTGLGLFLTREILNITDIDIVEEGKSGEGVSFRMTIPPGRWRPAEDS